MIVFWLSALLTQHQVFFNDYDQNPDYICPKCHEDWNEPDARWGLGMNPLQSLLSLFFFFLCSGLNAHRAAISQRKGFAGIQQRVAEAEVQKARASALDD